MTEYILAVLVPVALVVGWFTGRRALKRQLQGKSPRLTADYYRGLNYLLNEKPDKALDVFLHLVEVDGETIETHITLGKLFRRRGEIEKAIRVHQNLIARPTLSGADRSLALLELGRDYFSAGVFDRAEGLFKEVAAAGHHKQQAMASLIDIFVQEHEWQTAIQTAEAMERELGQNQSRMISHFFCELAATALAQSKAAEARRFLQQAHQRDGYSLRANVMRGELELQEGSYADALGYFVRVIELDSRFASEVLPRIQECLDKVDNRRLFRQLDALFNRLKRDGIYVHPLTQQIQDREGITEARRYLESIMQRQPGIEPLKDWLALHPASVETEAVRKQLDRLEEEAFPYQCEQCGYNSRSIQWHCPSCSNWGSIYPTYR